MFILQGSGSAAFSQLFIFAAIFVVFYLFFIRPQSKKQKEQNKFIGEVQKGDEIVTNSGMVGKINKIEGNVITLQVDQKTFIRILRSSVSKELTDGLATASTEEESK
jgi:preprotein translocase subunit YajC